ncbi:unnamed protein product [Rotaria sp. Silwood2]|nr:unnamed protein product [Rotaria sp. Silwood2]CAF4267846.1 unnamed protein product [Rotaria sp. Silwood2]CAF4359762.1 unnamed protein product [Rotaria sp. Silwood2]
MAWNRLQKYCLELNVFATGSNDIQIILHQRWSTRVYIVLFAVVLIVVGTIAGFDVRSIDKIVYSPSQSQFIKLVEKYPKTLRCPCSKIGIAYETFVHTHVKFHHVCSSAFVTQAWINSIFLQKNHSSSSTYDIRYYLRYFWEIIAGFCSFSNSTWIDAVTSFGALRIVSPIAVVEENLRIQAQTTLDSSMSFAQTVLVRNLLAIRSIIAGNQFVSGLTTNYYLSYSPSGFGNEATPKMLPRTYNNCSCLNFRGCPHPIIINTSYHQLFTIPGMIGDCFIVDATLASTLECYYNSSCFSLLHGESSINVKLLLENSNKRFLINSTVQALIDEAMVDSLTTEILFDSFYRQCSPTHCSYSYTNRFSFIFIITTIIGIYSGASFVLRLLVPQIVRYIFQRRNRKLTPHVISVIAVISRRQRRKLKINV